MAVMSQKSTDRYAVYNGDCCEVMPDLPDGKMALSVYSPPFSDLYNYSSSDRDLSNCRDYDQFLKHYDFVVKQIYRLMMPGRISCVHCCDIPLPGQKKGYRDFPGDIIRLHQDNGFFFQGRIAIWKEPLRVAIRTRLKHLTHKHLVKDSTVSFPAAGDFLLLFKKKGENAVPVKHPIGLNTYAGGREIPSGLMKYKGETNQKLNRLSHWIWRNYASCFWDDIRIERVLPYKASKEPDDEKHVCPLQLDVIERCVVLYSNPGESVFTPFMGVGSEVCGALMEGRRGVGIELKGSFYRQALRNIRASLRPSAKVKYQKFQVERNGHEEMV